MKVFINPGHAPGGNPDPGAVGPTGIREADVVADVGSIAAEYLRAAGCEVMVCQSNSLADICAQSNAWRADAFVSIHCNGYENPSATGMEIFTSRGQTKADTLASDIMAQMAGEFPTLPVRSDWSDGDIDKEAGLYVLIHTQAPAVLVELAFITNPKEEAILASAEGKRMFAAAIARGVTDWQVSNRNFVRDDNMIQWIVRKLGRLAKWAANAQGSVQGNEQRFSAWTLTDFGAGMAVGVMAVLIFL